MTYRPDFAAYNVAVYRDGTHAPIDTGDLTIHDDGKTYIYQGVDPRWHAAFFDWASALFADGKDTPHRLVGSAENGWRVEGGFEPPTPIPADDSDEYQAWLDGPYAEALRAWENEDRPQEEG